MKIMIYEREWKGWIIENFFCQSCQDASRCNHVVYTTIVLIVYHCVMFRNKNINNDWDEHCNEKINRYKTGWKGWKNYQNQHVN